MISHCPPQGVSQALLSRRGAGLLLAALSAAFGGCGYHIGSPYRTEIRSVYVPIFETQSFRRNLEFQLTEAVHKQIQLRTPFRLVKEGDADTKLTGKIVETTKRVLGETGFDDPRELELLMVVEVTWEDLRSGEILMQQRVPLTPEQVQLMSARSFAPEIGQSLATATQSSVDGIARKIVDMMETPW